jgi:hypothetical protein
MGVLGGTILTFDKKENAVRHFKSVRQFSSYCSKLGTDLPFSVEFCILIRENRRG